MIPIILCVALCTAAKADFHEPNCAASSPRKFSRRICLLISTQKRILAPLSLLISYSMTPSVNTLLLIKKRILILNLMLLHRETQESMKRFWVRKIFEDRTKKREFHLLVRISRLHGQQYLFRCYRMSPSTFEELLSFIAPIIIKETTMMRDPIGQAEILAATLRLLATGDAQCTIASSYRINTTSVSRIMSETCSTLWDSLMARKFLHPPSTELEWKAISQEFEVKWNFPNALGAIDGKHVVM